MSKEKKSSNGILPFAIGGLSGMGATCVVQPVDLVKTRMQVSQGAGVGPIGVVRDIVAKEGVRAMYRGLSAGLLRQATYTTTRMGVFAQMKEVLHDGEGPLPLYKKAIAGLAAGGIGALVGTPAEVSMIRMMADGRLPAEERRNYRSAFDALARIAREEGVARLWRGAGPTIGRAMILNMAQLASYDQAKQMLIRSGSFGDNLATHSVASLISGLLATAVSMPADIAKTRLQNMKGTEYSGTIDVLVKTARSEGVLSLWRGFTPYFFRLGPHTILTFIFIEQLNKMVH